MDFFRSLKKGVMSKMASIVYNNYYRKFDLPQVSFQEQFTKLSCWRFKTWLPSSETCWPTEELLSNWILSSQWRLHQEEDNHRVMMIYCLKSAKGRWYLIALEMTAPSLHSPLPLPSHHTSAMTGLFHASLKTLLHVTRISTLINLSMESFS